MDRTQEPAPKGLPWEDWEGPLLHWRIRREALDQLTNLREGVKPVVGLRRLAKVADVAYGTAQKINAESESGMDSVASFILGHRRLFDHKEQGNRDNVLSDAWIWWAVTRPADPLRETKRAIHNIPPGLGEPIGREATLRLIAAMVEQHRFVTLTGGPGFGKTTLACAFARSVLDGEWDHIRLVEFGSVGESGGAMAQVLRGLGIKEGGKREGLAAVRKHIGDLRQLVILDGCESALGTARETVATIIRHCPNAKVVATSWKLLRTAGERQVVVKPLPLVRKLKTAPVEQIRTNDAVRLFLQRAAESGNTVQSSESYLRSVAEVCLRLDGIPLAIEIAAAHWTPNEFLDAFAQEGFPKNGELAALIARTFDTLSPEEGNALASLSVFPESFDLDAARAVLSPRKGEADDALDLVTSLKEAGLLKVRSSQTPVRYRMLDTVRQVSGRRLEEQGGSDAVRERHRTHYLAIAQDAEAHLGGPDESWNAIVDREYPNLRAALAFRNDAVALQLVAALRRFWYHNGLYADGRELTEAALGSVGAEDTSEARAKALSGLGALLFAQTRLTEAGDACNDALRIARRSMPLVVGEACNTSGTIAHHEGNLLLAEERFKESRDFLQKAGSEGWLLVKASNNLAAVLNEQERHEEAERVYDENARYAGKIGYTHGRAVALTNQAVALMYQGKWREALDICRHGIDLQESGSRPKAHSLINLGLIYTELDRFVEAADAFSEAITTLGEVGALLCRPGNASDAVRLWEAARRIREETHCPLPANEARRLERYVSTARETLGEEAYKAQVYVGVRLTDGEAVKLALDRCRAILGP